MRHLWLELEGTPGSDILDCCQEAVAVANRLELNVQFRFNGVMCLVHTGDAPRELRARWQREIDLQRAHPTTRGNPLGQSIDNPNNT